MDGERETDSVALVHVITHLGIATSFSRAQVEDAYQTHRRRRAALQRPPATPEQAARLLPVAAEMATATQEPLWLDFCTLADAEEED